MFQIIVNICTVVGAACILTAIGVVAWLFYVLHKEEKERRALHTTVTPPIKPVPCYAEREAASIIEQVFSKGEKTA